MSNTSDGPRRRFAPVPIETTFESVRKNPQAQPGGYMPELTPSPSPRELSPPPHERPPPTPQEQQHSKKPKREKRKFAPQLVETSRRARRVGDTGPATKPADKTDITPYTNHIYVQRVKSRRKPHPQLHIQEDPRENNSPSDTTASRALPCQPKGARRESEDENAANYMLEWAAKEAERQMQEAALAAFPNSRAREGGAAHFYFRESSGDDGPSASTSPLPPGEEQPKHLNRHAHAVRRKSSDLGYWHKHMQEHAEKLAEERGETRIEPEPESAFDHDEEAEEEDVDMDDAEAGDAEEEDAEEEDAEMDDDELDKMELESPPDPLWLATGSKPSEAPPLPGPKGPIGESHMPLVSLDDQQSTKASRLAAFKSSTPATRPMPGFAQPAVAAAAAAGKPFMPVAQAQQALPETGVGNFRAGPFIRPFQLPGDREDSNQRRLRKAASPPMQGGDLRFRRCPSPKLTKLEPDHPFRQVEIPEEMRRDATGQNGLWRGFCYRRPQQDGDGDGDEDEDEDANIVPPSLQGPRMIQTPQPPSSPGDPFSQAFDAHVASDDATNGWSSSTTSAAAAAAAAAAEHRPRSGEAKGLHMLNLHSVEDKLRREKAARDREDKIAAEFDDGFVTQVYNYLSLGYPAMARAYDGELARISRMGSTELVADDERQIASGHITEETREAVPEEQRCPRWKALKAYILEWARQHPDLDNLDPLAWGVRERRGSWAV